MGAKIQANAFFPKYHSVIDLNGSCNTVRPIYPEIPKNGHNPDSFTSLVRKTDYPYQLEKVKQTILEHESIFRNQLQELHRLYGRQRELMNEIKMREIKKDDFWIDKNLRTFEPRLFPSDIYTSGDQTSYDRDTKLSLSDVFGFDLYLKRTNYSGGLSRTDPKDRNSYDLTLSRGEIYENPYSSINLVIKDIFQNSQSRTNGENFSSNLGLRNERSVKENFCEDYAVSRTKKKIFGVEISEGNGLPFDAASNNSSTTDPKIEPRHQENPHTVVSFKSSSWVGNSCMQIHELGGTNVNDGKNEKPMSGEMSIHENPKNGLPWFLKNPQVNGDPSKTKKSSYFMNLDSLQNYSEKFFREVETDENVRRHNPETKKLVLDKGLNNRTADPRHHIDLNLSLDEEDAQPTPSLATAAVEIATAGTHLEARAVIELETCARNSEVSYEERDEIAAEAIVAISSSAAANRLKWFADIITSDRSGPHHEKQSVPDGMDDFEFMTLKLEDVKVEEQMHYEVLGEKGGATLSKRCRRGRRRRDFQRDVLPGLVTLSRLEVTEDFQAFEELTKAEGGTRLSRRAPVRNGRGRKRFGGRKDTGVVRSGRAGGPVCQLEERGLTGWGRRTRRLPRQRCHNGFLAFAVKC